MTAARLRIATPVVALTVLSFGCGGDAGDTSEREDVAYDAAGDAELDARMDARAEPPLPDVEDEPDVPPPVEICGDGIDNDGDGWIDCRDITCEWLPECAGEICDDGVDNDVDGQVDCDDPDCSGELPCGIRYVGYNSLSPCTPGGFGNYAVVDVWAVEQLPGGGYIFADSSIYETQFVPYVYVTGELWRMTLADLVHGSGGRRECNFRPTELCPIGFGNGGTTYVYVASGGTCANAEYADYVLVVESAVAAPRQIANDVIWGDDEDCSDGIDNNLNGDVDCEDTRCRTSSSCD